MSYKHSITLDDLCFSLPKIKKKRLVMRYALAMSWNQMGFALLGVICNSFNSLKWSNSDWFVFFCHFFLSFHVV